MYILKTYINFQNWRCQLLLPCTCLFLDDIVGVSVCSGQLENFVSNGFPIVSFCKRCCAIGLGKFATHHYCRNIFFYSSSKRQPILNMEMFKNMLGNSLRILMTLEVQDFSHCGFNSFSLRTRTETCEVLSGDRSFKCLFFLTLE